MVIFGYRLVYYCSFSSIFLSLDTVSIAHGLAIFYYLHYSNYFTYK